MIGDMRLLDSAKLPLFCSTKCPGELILTLFDSAKELRVPARARPVWGSEAQGATGPAQNPGTLEPQNPSLRPWSPVSGRFSP